MLTVMTSSNSVTMRLWWGNSYSATVLNLRKAAKIWIWTQKVLQIQNMWKHCCFFRGCFHMLYPISAGWYCIWIRSAISPYANLQSGKFNSKRYIPGESPRTLMLWVWLCFRFFLFRRTSVFSGNTDHIGMFINNSIQDLCIPAALSELCRNAVFRKANNK